MPKLVSSHMAGVDCPLCDDGTPHTHEPPTKRVTGGVTGEVRYESDERTSGDETGAELPAAEFDPNRFRTG